MCSVKKLTGIISARNLNVDFHKVKYFLGNPFAGSMRSYNTIIVINDQILNNLKKTFMVRKKGNESEFWQSDVQLLTAFVKVNCVFKARRLNRFGLDCY